MKALIAGQPPKWREATQEEARAFLSEGVVYNDAGSALEARYAGYARLEVLEGPALPCGCIPHVTHTSRLTGYLVCDTEEQPYCNFECPHEEEEEEPE